MVGLDIVVVGISSGGLNVMSLGVTYVVGLLMCRVNCSFSCAYDMGAHVLLLGAARSSMFSIPTRCCSVVMLSKFADMMCVIGRVSDSGVGVNDISMLILSRCGVG